MNWNEMAEEFCQNYVSECIEDIKDEYDLWESDEIDSEWVMENFNMDELLTLNELIKFKIKHLEGKYD